MPPRIFVLLAAAVGSFATSLFQIRDSYGKNLVDGIALHANIERKLNAPFLENFDKCMNGIIVDADMQYGPLPRCAKVIDDLHHVHPILENIQNLESFLIEAKRHSPILLMSFTGTEKRYFGFIKNWFDHVQRVKLSRHTLVVTSSFAECSLVSSRSPCVVNGWRRATGFGSQPAGEFRWAHTLKMLQLKYNVIQTDADAFIMTAAAVTHLENNPFLVLGLSDSLADGHVELDYCALPGAVCQSTGFTYFRSHPTVVSELASFVARLHAETGWEQEMWQTHAKNLRKAGVYQILNTSGPHAFANWYNIVSEIRHELNLTIYVTHMGYIFEKELVYQCAQLWYGEGCF